MQHHLRKMLAAFGIVAALCSPLHAQGAAPRNLNTAQVSCGTGATALAPINMNRSTITIENTTATAVYLGGSGVTVANGHLLPGVIGASITLNTSAAIFCIASVAATVSYVETFY